MEAENTSPKKEKKQRKSRRRKSTMVPVRTEHRQRFQIIPKNPPMPISHDYDILFKYHGSSVDVDRTDWTMRVMSEQPELMTLRECVNPVVRAAVFGRKYLPSYRLIDPNELMKLISQHLRILGLVETEAMVREEWTTNYNYPMSLRESQLTKLVQRGLRRLERFYELFLPSAHKIENEKERKLVIDRNISDFIGANVKITENKRRFKDEPEGDPEHLRYDGDTIVEASLNQLFYMCTKLGDDELLKAFCLNFTSFSTAPEILEKIKEMILLLLADLRNPEVTEDEQRQIRLRVQLTIKLLKEWLKMDVVRNDWEICEEVADFVRANLIPDFEKFCHGMFTDATKEEAPKVNTQEVNLGPLVQSIWTGKFRLTDLPPDELARQITMWTSSRFYNIKRDEILDNAFNNPRLQYRAPNIIALSNNGNRLSAWVAHEIVFEESLDKRIELINYFVQLSHKLYTINNLYDAGNIISGLFLAPISRLVEHMKLFEEKYPKSVAIRNELQGIFVDDVHFTQGKKIQKDIRDEFAIIPSISTFLGEYFQYTDSAVIKVGELINVRKIRRIYNLITELERFKKVKYNYIVVDQIQDKLNSMEFYNEKDFDVRSQMIEPDQATREQLYNNVPKELSKEDSQIKRTKTPPTK